LVGGVEEEHDVGAALLEFQKGYIFCIGGLCGTYVLFRDEQTYVVENTPKHPVDQVSGSGETVA
jgi:hypothetical protein